MDAHRIERRGPSCFEFGTLERIAKSDDADLHEIKHLAGCVRCRELLQKFRKELWVRECN